MEGDSVSRTTFTFSQGLPCATVYDMVYLVSRVPEKLINVCLSAHEHWRYRFLFFYFKVVKRENYLFPF